jgi:hypothetical protein
MGRQWLGKRIPAKGNLCNNRSSVFSVVCAVRIDTQRCGKHFSAAMNQYTTIEEVMFSVGGHPKSI